MTTKTYEETFDFAYGDGETFAEARADFEKKYGVHVEVVEDAGPGGEWPVVRLRGKKEAVAAASAALLDDEPALPDVGFDPATAAASAEVALVRRENELVARAREEAAQAADLAREYAALLAAGGNAWEFPEPPLRNGERPWSRSFLVPYKLGLAVVFEKWNAARGDRANPFSAVEFPKKYRIAEFALARVGEPMLYSDLGHVGAVMTKTASDEVATVLAALQWTNGRDLVLRRRRVDGKVAYLLRPRQDGERHVGEPDEDGRAKHTVYPPSVPLEQKPKAVAS